MNVLLPQVRTRADVEVVAFYNHRQHEVGYLRQALVDDAQGVYVNFIDDDDRISERYVEALYPHLDGKNDQVGFQMEIRVQGGPPAPVYCDPGCGGWHDLDDGYYRDINHCCPIKRAVAQRGTFDTGNRFEDAKWSDQIRGIPRRWHYVDEVLYFYDYDPETSITQRDDKAKWKGRPRVAIDSPHFRYHGQSDV